MPEYKKVYLKKGKDFQLKNRHRWIFSGAIDKMDKHENGEEFPFSKCVNAVVKR